MNKIRNYNILKQLGEGGMGAVYLAEEELTERKVALKVLHPQLTNKTNFKERFIREAKVLGQLKHPSIIGLLSLFEENGSYCMVMEYFEGETLKNMILRRGPIPEQEVENIALQILKAVSHAHDRNIIHRDIKPSNIIIDKNGRVGVLDFGIAKVLADADYTKTGTMLGTLYYMSPEQIKGEKNIDNRTDIYCTGITIYEMLAGRLPFEIPAELSEFTRGEIALKIVNEDFPDPRKFYPHISNEFVEVVKKMTSRLKDHRYVNCEECINSFTRKAKYDSEKTVLDEPNINVGIESENGNEEQTHRISENKIEVKNEEYSDLIAEYLTNKMTDSFSELKNASTGTEKGTVGEIKIANKIISVIFKSIFYGITQYLLSVVKYVKAIFCAIPVFAKRRNG